MKPEFSFDECFLGAVTVGERGQVVIPADARKRYDIQPGDKLLVMAHPSSSGLMFFKTDAMREFASFLLEGLTKVEQAITGSDGDSDKK